jgi:hypothetical protein
MAMLVIACQIALTSVPLATFVRSMAGVPIKAECLCDAPGHDHATCPMHHSQKGLASRSPDAGRCRLSQAAAIHVDFLLATGSLPEPILRVTLPTTSAPVSIGDTIRFESRSSTLDPPPPRS